MVTSVKRNNSLHQLPACTLRSRLPLALIHLGVDVAAVVVAVGVGVKDVVVAVLVAVAEAAHPRHNRLKHH